MPETFNATTTNYPNYGPSLLDLILNPKQIFIKAVFSQAQEETLCGSWMKKKAIFILCFLSKTDLISRY